MFPGDKANSQKAKTNKLERWLFFHQYKPFFFSISIFLVITKVKSWYHGTVQFKVISFLWKTTWDVSSIKIPLTLDLLQLNSINGGDLQFMDMSEILKISRGSI